MKLNRKNEVYQHKTQIMQEQINNLNGARKSIQHKVNNLQFMDMRAKKLASYYFGQKFLSGKDNFFRKEQEGAFRSLIKDLNSGGNGGMIKLPTGAGKTFYFGNVIKGLDCPSIILVPRENLVDGTYDELVGNEKKIGLGFNPDAVEKIYGKEKGNTFEQAKKILEKGDFQSTLIITYQSFVKLCETQPQIFHELTKNIGCIISDEAHRSLGEKTTQAIDNAKTIISQENEDIEDIFDEVNEIKAEQLIDSITKKSDIVHLHMTATPNLSNKQIDEKIIHSVTFGESVTNGNLILPKQINSGIAHTEVFGNKVTENENKKGLDKFYFENGIHVYEKLTLQYIREKKENSGYLPTVAFCNTTEQVEFYVDYLQSKGIKAIQCTTNINGTNYCDINTAEARLEKGETDIIVTCSKVGEGWDLPTLRGVIWLVPSISPARVMQGTGRITRVLKEDDIKRLIKCTGLPREVIDKTHNNTLIFSPNKWEYSNREYYYGNQSRTSEGGLTKGSMKGNSLTGDELGHMYTGIEIYALYGELTVEQKYQLGLHIEPFNRNQPKKVNLRTLWNYEGKSLQESYDYFMNLSARGISKLDFGGIKIISFKNFSGVTIDGNIKNPTIFRKWIEKVFEGMDINKLIHQTITLNENKQVEIDGILYTAINKSMLQIDYPDLPDNGANIYNKIKKLTPEERADLGGITLSTNNIIIYELKKIQEKFRIIYLNEKKQAEVNGVIYTAIIKNMKKSDYPDLPDNGKNIYNKIKELSPNQRKKLGGVGLNGRISAQKVELYELQKIKDNFSIFTLDDNYQVEINGIIYTAITTIMKQSDHPELPDNGKNIYNKIKKLSPNQREELGGVGLKGRLLNQPLELYELKKIQEKFGKK